MIKSAFILDLRYKGKFYRACKDNFLGPMIWFFLNSVKVWEDLISNGRNSHILGPKNDKDSVP